jgi:hypothetical protein
MKQSMLILLISIMAMLSSMAFAQSGYVYAQELMDGGHAASRSVFVCSDNSVVVLGNADDTLEFHSYYLTITKLNPQGELMWRQWMGGSDLFVSITGVDIDANDTVTFITTAEYIRLWSIDRDGTLHFLSVGTDIPNQGITFNKALRTPDNEIVAVGKASQNYDVSSACFFRFSATGDTLATAFWPVDQGSQYLEAGAYDLALMDNGNILVTCYLSSILGSVLEIDINGDILNRVDILGIFWSIYSSLTINRSLDNESFILAGTTGPHPDYSIKVFLLFAGELTFLFEVDNSILTWVSSVKLQTDSMYLCGRVFEGGLINVSYSGDINWVWNQQGDNTCEYINAGFGSPSTALLDLDSDGCVYWAWGNSGQQVIIKLLPNGQVPVQDDVQTPPVNAISAYPNPMKDHLNIKITQDDKPVIAANHIDIFNIKGQLIRSLKLTKGETVWDGKDNNGNTCPNGVYLIRSADKINPITKICKIH